MNQSPTIPSMDDKCKKMESLNKKIDFLESVREKINVLIFVLGVLSMYLLWAPITVLGISFRSILLGSHTISFLCLFIIHYKVLPPLIDECSITSHGIAGQQHFLPAYHPSKTEMFWCILRITLPILTSFGIWVYIWYKDTPEINNDDYECEKVTYICFFLGMFLLFLSLFVQIQLTPLCIVPQVKNHTTKQGIEVDNRRVSLQALDLLSTKDNLEREKNEETTKLRTELLEKDASYSKLLQEKEAFYANLFQKIEQEIKGLRKEYEELTRRIERSLVENENSKESQ